MWVNYEITYSIKQFSLRHRGQQKEWAHFTARIVKVTFPSFSTRLRFFWEGGTGIRFRSNKDVGLLSQKVIISFLGSDPIFFFPSRGKVNNISYSPRQSWVRAAENGKISQERPGSAFIIVSWLRTLLLSIFQRVFNFLEGLLCSSKTKVTVCYGI